MDPSEYLILKCSACIEDTFHEYTPEPVKINGVVYYQYQCLECMGGTATITPVSDLEKSLKNEDFVKFLEENIENKKQKTLGERK